MEAGQPPTLPKPPDPRPSYADAVASVEKKLLPLSTYKGEPACIIPKENVEESLAGFKFALVGKFPISPKPLRPSMERIRLFFARLNLQTSYSVGSLDLGHILIRLNSAEDYHRLWAREVWEVDRIRMKIFKWSIDFVSNKESPIVPAWILLPGLPPNLFKKHILFSIVQAVGNPLKMDHATETILRPSVARVCVEIDVSTPNPARIWVACGSKEKGFWQRIEYEYLPPYCSDCSKLGHDISSCQGNMSPPLNLQHDHTQSRKKIAVNNAGRKMTQDANVQRKQKQQMTDTAGPQNSKVWIQKEKSNLRKSAAKDISVNAQPVGNDVFEGTFISGEKTSSELEDLQTINKRSSQDISNPNEVAEHVKDASDSSPKIPDIIVNPETEGHMRIIIHNDNNINQDHSAEGSPANNPMIEDNPGRVNGKEVFPCIYNYCDDIDLTNYSSDLKALARGFLRKKNRSTFKRRRKPVRGEPSKGDHWRPSASNISPQRASK